MTPDLLKDIRHHERHLPGTPLSRKSQVQCRTVSLVINSRHTDLTTGVYVTLLVFCKKSMHTKRSVTEGHLTAYKTKGCTYVIITVSSYTCVAFNP